MTGQPQVVHCKQCVFFNPFPSGDPFGGYCQFNAPIVDPRLAIMDNPMSERNLKGKFPTVRENWFCGQGELRTE